MTSFCFFSLVYVQVITPEAPCRVTWDRYRQRAPMSNELAELLREVEQLRKETDALICNCNQPDCPFHNPSKSMGSQSSLNSLEFSQSSEEDDRLSLKRQFSPPTISLLRGGSGSPRLERLRSARSTGNLTCVIPGIQRRPDGTIIEGDYPGYSGGGKPIKMRRCGTYNGFTHLDIANCVIRETEDCAVDYENTFSTDGYEFKRQAPERKQFRSPRIQKRGHSKLKNSASYPAGTDRKISSPAMIHNKLADSDEESQLRGRSSSSPQVVTSTGTRHMSIDQAAHKQWSPPKNFNRNAQQA